MNKRFRKRLRKGRKFLASPAYIFQRTLNGTPELDILIPTATEELIVMTESTGTPTEYADALLISNFTNLIQR